MTARIFLNGLSLSSTAPSGLTFPGATITGSTFTDSLFTGTATFGTTGTNVDPTIYGSLVLSRTASVAVAPELQYYGAVGAWLSGIDVANNGGGRDFVVAARNNNGTVNDIIYLNWNGGTDPVTIGLGVTPPSGDYTVQMSSPDADLTYGALSIRAAPSLPLTTKLINVINSAGTTMWSMDGSGYFGPTLIRDTSSPTTPLLGMYNNAVSAAYGFYFSTADIRFRYVTGGTDIANFGTNGKAFWYQEGQFNDSFVTSAMAPRVQTLAADTTLTTSSYAVSCNTSGGALTMTLPASPRSYANFLSGQLIWIKNSGSAANDVTIARNGKTINGAAADLTLTDGQVAALFYDQANSNWVRFI